MKVARIVFFSGTGSTNLVAGHLSESLETNGFAVELQHLRHDQPDLPGIPDLLVVAFAVHACNAPHPIHAWIKRLPGGWLTDADGKKRSTALVVVSNSGGGEVYPNRACRSRVIRQLGRKGYRCVHESMVVLPSNWIIQTPEALAVHLLDILPLKLERVIAEVQAGIERRCRPRWFDHLTSWLGRAETLGAKSFGKRIKVASDCTGCAICARGCPVGNISMRDQRPHFGDHCVLCLRCLYACPPQALKPGMAKFILVPQGYSLASLQARQPWQGPIDVEALTKGAVWAGIRSYLKEPDAR